MRAVRLSLFLAALLCLPACGGKEEKPAAPPTTPAGSAAQTPYGGAPYAAGAGGQAKGLDPALRKKVDEALETARKNLLSIQAESGAWGDKAMGMPPNVGFTALAAVAVIDATPSTEVSGDSQIHKALEYLVSHQQENGAIFDNKDYINYMTSAAIAAFSAAKMPAYRNAQVLARDYLAKSQIAGDQADVSYDGFPYGEEEGQPADLSNLQFAVEALHDAGLPADSPVWERIRVYLNRVQNRSESNNYVYDGPLGGEEEGKDLGKGKVVAGDDGGARYSPAASKAGLVKRSDGTYEARSYGSMTYALLKCFLLAGVDAKDPRVVAALGWLAKNFTVDRNPGFEASEDPEKAGQQGYYYYVMTMARALSEYEKATKKPLDMKDAEGKSHDWRAELAQALLARRSQDGWWKNDKSERWNEGSRLLATSYATIALANIAGRAR